MPSNEKWRLAGFFVSHSSTKEFQPLQPVSQVHWEPTLNASMQT